MSYPFYGNRPLLNPATLNRLRQQVGPQNGESRAEVWYPEQQVAAGTGFKKVVPPRAIFPCRYMYIGMLSQKERDVMGIVAQNGQHLVSLPALTRIDKDCQLVIIGQEWTANRVWLEGLLVTPNADLLTNKIDQRRVFRAVTSGTSGKSTGGSIEPLWPSAKGSSVTDGDVTWIHNGYGTNMGITEVMQSTYEVTRRVIGMNRS
jgi:hypothetical protein